MGDLAIKGRVKAGPAFHGSLGVVFLFLFLIGLLSQMETTQIALLGGTQPIDVFRPNWLILIQPLQLIGILPPPLSGKEGTVAFTSWVITIIYIGCVVGNEIFDDAKKGKGVIFTNLFRVAIFSLLAYDFWTDFQYGAVIFGFGWSAFIFALAVAFVVAFFGIIGTDFIEKAYKGL
jgi:hypothetical protein